LRSGSSAVDGQKRGLVDAGELRHHPLFGRTAGGVVRQVTDRFAKPELRNQVCTRRAHTENLEQSWGLASYIFGWETADLPG
jgi:hypothetical protein